MTTNRTPRPITARQRAAWEYICEEVKRQGYPPTMREIGLEFGINSTNGVRSMLSAIEQKGYLRREPYLSRGIEILKWPRRMQERDDVMRVPIVGRVAAGLPLLADQNIDGEVLIDRSLFPTGDGFALRVKGESMLEAGIRDGDIVLARPDLPVQKGSIVVALLGEEATVKYYHPERFKVRLEPANPSFMAIQIDKGDPDFKIVGKVVGLYRRY